MHGPAHHSAPMLRPWGVTRATPVVPDLELSYSYVQLDAATQVARYRDMTGDLVEATGHKHEGTTKTVSRCNPAGAGDGKNPTPPDDAQVTTYVPD